MLNEDNAMNQEMLQRFEKRDGQKVDYFKCIQMNESSEAIHCKQIPLPKRCLLIDARYRQSTLRSWRYKRSFLRVLLQRGNAPIYCLNSTANLVRMLVNSKKYLS